MVAQIRARSRRDTSASANLPEVTQERSRARVRAAVDLDEERPYELQQTLQLQGTWNVTPRDLVASERRGTGSVLTALRRLARPVLKLFANFELPLYKQFKINLGMAELLNELLNRTADLEGQLDDAHRRIEQLEAQRPHDEPDLG